MPKVQIQEIGPSESFAIRNVGLLPYGDPTHQHFRAAAVVRASDSARTRPGRLAIRFSRCGRGQSPDGQHMDSPSPCVAPPRGVLSRGDAGNTPSRLGLSSRPPVATSFWRGRASLRVRTHRRLGRGLGRQDLARVLAPSLLGSPSRRLYCVTAFLPCYEHRTE